MFGMQQVRNIVHLVSGFIPAWAPRELAIGPPLFLPLHERTTANVSDNDIAHTERLWRAR
jgi:hypothetical protein